MVILGSVRVDDKNCYYDRLPAFEIEGADTIRLNFWLIGFQFSLTYEKVLVLNWVMLGRELVSVGNGVGVGLGSPSMMEVVGCKITSFPRLKKINFTYFFHNWRRLQPHFLKPSLTHTLTPLGPSRTVLSVISGKLRTFYKLKKVRTN